MRFMKIYIEKKFLEMKISKCNSREIYFKAQSSNEVIERV